MKKQSSKQHGESKIVRKRLTASSKGQTNWAVVRAMRDEDIQYDGDSPNLADNADFWANAVPWVPPSAKQQLSMRLDVDILEWFKGQGDGKGYQQHINHALRSYMQQAQKAGSRRAKTAVSKRVKK